LFINSKTTTKKVKIVQRCKKCDANAKCETSANTMQMGLDKSAMRMKRFRTTIPGTKYACSFREPEEVAIHEYSSRAVRFEVPPNA
jgi:hypothetical protein